MLHCIRKVIMQISGFPFAPRGGYDKIVIVAATFNSRTYVLTRHTEKPIPSDVMPYVYYNVFKVAMIHFY